MVLRILFPLLFSGCSAQLGGTGTLSVSGTTLFPKSPACPFPDYFPKCYYILWNYGRWWCSSFKPVGSYQQAKSQCSTRNSTIAMMKNAFDYEAAVYIASFPALINDSIWIGLENNYNNASCLDEDCVGQPMWADGTPLNNSDGYISGGIDVYGSDVCFLMDSDGSITGHQYRCNGSTKYSYGYLCMSTCHNQVLCDLPMNTTTPPHANQRWSNKTRTTPLTPGFILR